MPTISSDALPPGLGVHAVPVHPEGCFCPECLPTPLDELTEEEIEYFAKAIPQFPEKEDDDAEEG